MNVMKALEKRKKEIEIYLNVTDFNNVKSATLFKLLIKELSEMENFFSKKEIVEFINNVFNISINYNTYYKFSRNHLEKSNTRSKNVKNKNSNNEVDTSLLDEVSKNNNNDSIAKKSKISVSDLLDGMDAKIKK